MNEFISNIPGRLFELINNYPNNKALSINDQEFSYKDIGETALYIANWLTQDLYQQIILYGDKDPYIYKAMWGAILAKKTYIPLNPREEEINVYILNQFRSSIIFTTQQFLNDILKIIPAADFYGKIVVMDKEVNEENILGYSIFNNFKPLNIKPISSGEEIIYLLFTSGSTGKPKGVPISSANLMAYLNNMLEIFNFNSDDNFSHAAEVTFDLSVQEFFIPWVIGAKVTVVKPSDFYNIIQFMQNKQITVWSSVPSVIPWLLKRGQTYNGLKTAIFIGEALYKNYCKSLQKTFPNSAIYNMYGPTEATVACGYYQYNQENHDVIPAIVPIGKIFNDHEFTIINENQKAANEGELCLQGAQVFKGYYNNQAKNNEVFVHISGKNGLWYRTGDIVTRDNYQGLLYVGRADQQIKISGVRINKHELEATIKDLTQAKHVMIIGYPCTADNTKHYSAIIVCLEATMLTEEKGILSLLNQKLPPYIKIFQVLLTKFPINRSGKIDYLQVKALIKDKYAEY